MRMLSKTYNGKPEVLNRGAYYDGIVNTILEIGAAEKFIIAIAELIQRLVVDHLHIIGDIYDRGSGAHKIMDKLCSYHSLDIQWGNHDILWMGALSAILLALQPLSETVSDTAILTLSRTVTELI